MLNTLVGRSKETRAWLPALDPHQMEPAKPVLLSTALAVNQPASSVRRPRRDRTGSIINSGLVDLGQPRMAIFVAVSFR